MTPVGDVVLREDGDVSTEIYSCVGAVDGVFVEQANIVGRQWQPHELLYTPHRVFEQVHRCRRAGARSDDGQNDVA